MDFQTWIQDHVFTASELEDYLLCPFRFYAGAFLGLKSGWQRDVELTPPEMGNLVHRILERLLSEENGQDLGTAKIILSQEMSQILKEKPHLSPALLKLQRLKIERMLENFLQDLEEGRRGPDPLKPAFFEWEFGRRTPPLKLQDAEGRDVFFRGRIDRIDVDTVQKRFLVVDYKTGSTRITGSQILSGSSFQLPIYLFAVGDLLLKDHEPIGCVYHQLSDMMKQDGLLHGDRIPESMGISPRVSSVVVGALWEETLSGLRTRIGDLVSEIRNTPENGFLSHDEACEPYCPFQDVCRLRTVS